MWKEFKAFAMRGNVIDLAIGVILGGAFGKIVSSFVSDILMPPIGMLMGKVNFADLFIDLSGEGYASLGGGAGGRRGDDQLRCLLQHHFGLRHRRFRDLPGCPPDQQDEEGRASRTGGADDEGVPLLLHRHPHQGDALPALHVGVGWLAWTSYSVQ